MPTDEEAVTRSPESSPTTVGGKRPAGIFWRGFCVGAADVVPGVSGGTIAFILGIYEELIDSLRTFGRPKFFRALLRMRVRELLRVVNWKFLFPLGCGVLAAIFTLAKGLQWLLVHHPQFLWSFFFGLVLASVLAVKSRVRQWTPPRWVLLVVGAVFSYGVVGLVPMRTTDAAWFFILSGAVASCALILPGVSGAFMLVLLGKYQAVLTAVNDRDFVVVGLVGVGAVVGLVTCSQILGWLFRKFHDPVVALLIGLILGSLRKVWPWKQDTAWLANADGNQVLKHGQPIVTEQSNILPPFSSGEEMLHVGLAIGLAAAGFALVLLVERLGKQDAPG